jgi:hypothetical protein
MSKRPMQYRLQTLVIAVPILAAIFSAMAAFFLRHFTPAELWGLLPCFSPLVPILGGGAGAMIARLRGYDGHDSEVAVTKGIGWGILALFAGALLVLVR